MTAIRRYVRPEQLRELILVVIILAVVLFFGSQIENYYNVRLFNRITSDMMIILVVAVGQTLVILTRNIDLSVGSIVGFVAFFVGRQVANNNDLSPIALIALSIGVGALLGLINGLLVSYGKIPAIIVTLGTLAIFRGFLVEYSGAKTVTSATLPKWLVDLNGVNLFKIGDVEVRVLAAVAIVIVIVAQLALNYLPFGRRLYAIGSNPEAARIAGMPTQRILMIAYVLCGALSGLAGFLFLARFANITVVAGQGLELQVVAAVVVGGVNIFGGSGTMLGAMLGAVLIGIIQNSLIRMQISQFWIDALTGFFILLAVTSDAIILNRIRNLWARSERQLQLTEVNTAAQRSAADGKRA